MTCLDPHDAVPLEGPLDQLPGVARAQAEAMLSAALTGLDLGTEDRRAADALRTLDPDTVATVASLLRRTWQAGVDVGRTEQVDEHPRVEALDNALTDLTHQAEDLRRRLEEQY